MPSTTITWDNLNTAGPIADFDQTLKDGVFKPDMLLDKLTAKQKTYPGSEKLTEPVVSGKSNAGTFDKYKVVNPTDPQIMTTSEYTPGHYFAEIGLSYTDELANSGPNKILDLLEAKYFVAQRSLRFLFSTHLYQDGTTSIYDIDGVTVSTKPIVGLAAVTAVRSATPTDTYGNITRGSTSATDYWKNQYKDGVSLAGAFGTNLNILQNLWGLCSKQGEHPDIICTTQAVYDKIWEKADPRQRLGNEAAAKLGYQSIDFNGVPLIVDTNCTAGTLYMLNTNYLYFKVHANDNFKSGPFMQPSNQFVKVKYITWTGQLVCSNPRFQGVMFNLV